MAVKKPSADSLFCMVSKVNSLVCNILLIAAYNICTVQPIKFSDQMLSDTLTCSRQLYYVENPYCLALQKVARVSTSEEGHRHSEKFMHCTV